MAATDCQHRPAVIKKRFTNHFHIHSLSTARDTDGETHLPFVLFFIETLRSSSVSELDVLVVLLLEGDCAVIQ